jgi:hypothetical protein
MNIYLKHPIHGHKVATMEMEAEFDESNGWVRYNLGDPEDEEELPEIQNQLQVKRRGRPPKSAA